MQTRLWASIIIFISSYSPMFLIFAIRDYENKSFKHPEIIWFSLIISIISIIFLYFVMRQISSGFTIKIKNISNRSSELVNYTVPYIVSFTSIDLGKTQDIISFLIFMILMCVLTILTKNHFINPILTFFGYGLYEIDFEEGETLKNSIFLSKIDIKKNEIYRMQKISKYLFIITEKSDIEGD